MKNRIGLGFLLAWLIAGPVQEKDINLGWSGIGSWTTLPYVVANEKGFFDKENLKVQLITFRGTNLMLTALLAGELDYAICECARDSTQNCGDRTQTVGFYCSIKIFTRATIS
ncbi:MAG TPA: ABC transporter substrate-binding protein [Candidatus Eisenbacteria bacterium]|nr:ABC transporter substrate-binding protein [Candidatus Eisenbacteria bacterium]